MSKKKFESFAVDVSEIGRVAAIIDHQLHHCEDLDGKLVANVGLGALTFATHTCLLANVPREVILELVRRVPEPGPVVPNVVDSLATALLSGDVKDVDQVFERLLKTIRKGRPNDSKIMDELSKADKRADEIIAKATAQNDTDKN